MVLRSVGVLSAGKIMGVLGAFGGLLAGAILALVGLLGGVVQHQQGGPGNGALPAMFVGVGAVVFLPILYGIFGFIGGMIYALFYNLAAGIIGGLELDLDARQQTY
jgi:hypothetical protein